ncbi:hypothetical protein WMY93_000879 [Mugilogobius chulae]|uniref:G-protein coupled receptors family 1 profile domain-containing protein n=1 Tax=Mugilogobius chulae TaxID=88201 RepID=A0AAW0Q069_9GOBI
MFAVGVLGNVIAVVVLCVSKREQKESTFYTLVCGMAVTDLLGTCFTSPVVIATYACGRWPGGAPLCHFFSFSMLFFGCAGTCILCAMAVERYLAINHAYFYSQHVDRSVARTVLLVTYLATLTLCVLPSFGFGRHVRHFPGTWCFLDWRATDALGACYSLLYGGVMLLLVAVTLLCNVAVCLRQLRGRDADAVAAGVMTAVFLVCSVPLVVRIFVNQLTGPAHLSAEALSDKREDLLAIRFASFNPILDPWVYILCRKNLLLKGCARLKGALLGAKVRGVGGRPGWEGGQNSPASMRTSFRQHPFSDLTTGRQPWDFHPFSVPGAGLGAGLGLSGLVAEEGEGLKEEQQQKKSNSQTPLLVTSVIGGDVVTCTLAPPQPAPLSSVCEDNLSPLSSVCEDNQPLPQVCEDNQPPLMCL